jgi:hypothetical protein
VYLARDRFEIVRIPDEGGPGSTVWFSDSLYPSHLTPLPDARGVLFQACVPPCQTSDLWVLDLNTGSARVAVPDARSGYYVATGHLVYASEGQAVQAIRFDLKSLQTRGASQVVLDLVAFAGNNPYFSVSILGTLVMQSRENPAAGEFEAVWIDASGRETPADSGWTFRVTQFAADYGWALSPSGNRLAIGLNTPAGDDVWIKELPRGPVSRVTYGSGPERRPRWMPDGRSVTFVSDGGFYMRRADGTGSDSQLWSGSFDEGVISPDGNWLLFRMGARSAVAGGRDIYGVQPAVDSSLVPLVVTPFDEVAIALSLRMAAGWPISPTRRVGSKCSSDRSRTRMMRKCRSRAVVTAHPTGRGMGASSTI